MWPLRVVDFLLLKAGLSTGLANRTSIPTSRFLMSTDVIAHILRLSEPKVVMASCSHGTNPGTAHTDVASHPSLGDRLPEFYSFRMHECCYRPICTA
jgi:hypothetical protein